MSKKKLLYILIAVFVFMGCKNVYAFDINNYKDRNLCGNYEVAGFHSDGVIDKVKCFSNYNDAKNFMKNNGANDLAIMTKVNGQTKIIDANVALLDLTVNPDILTYYYTNSELTGSAFTYMDNGSLYGGVDGVHLDSAYSNSKGKWTAKVKIASFVGWISIDTYEIVPITWVKSSSYYVVNDSDIRHNIVSKIQNTYSGYSGRNIGPKPSMLNNGTYYSYDGHYFYKDLTTLIKDNKNNNYNNSVNKNNPYYNYYMYLSNHTKTAYSSSNIDEYIRNNMGYKENVYGNKANGKTSRLYGMGTFFYHAQEKYGVNAILALSLSRNESGNGTSYLSINKNNGFGLNAVDTNPIEGASWYPTFQSSILGYAYKWVLNGYAHPSDWRYYGPQFGDKSNGMNVKYASDAYWSENMATHYYSLDKALGMQDYNYYQLGKVNGRINAYSSPSTSSKVVYVYPEINDGVVIVDEVVKNNEKWYKLVSDLNIDSNFYEKNGDYNWNGYVYVKANDVVKINQGKNGYIDPNKVFEYKDKNYEYNLYVENNEYKPKVAITTKNSDYYYDSTLNSRMGKTVLKDRYVMVFATAYDNGMPVAHLITSDYFHDQKHWVAADSVKFTDTTYGKVSVTVSGNCYTWVNYNKEDKEYSVISGLYTYTYVPILESSKVGNDTWYKVPVNLTGNDNVYGYTLASAPGVSITTSKSVVVNSKPTITASDKEIDENATFDPKKDVVARDAEDGDITNKLEVIENTVKTSVAGTYKVVYKVTDSANQSVTKEIKVIVKLNNAPIITAKDVTLEVGDTFDPKKGVTAKDTEDGDLTNKIKVTTNTVNTSKVGTYKVIYEVSDSKNKKTTKEIKVVVNKKEVIEEEASQEFNTTVNELKEKSSKGEFYLENLVWDKNSKKYTISGYQIILNQNNKDKEYYLVLVNKNNDKLYRVKVGSWNNNTPYDLGSENGKTYTNSWFRGTLDLSNVPNGDYDLYMLTTMREYSSFEVVNNIANQDISRRGQDAKHGYNFKVQQKNKAKEIVLSVRDELYTTNESPTSRNMVNGYDSVEFKNNKLYLYGYSYDIDATYNDQSKITRKLILENNNTYKQTISDLGSVKGPFAIETFDKKDKTYAWFEKEIDVSNLAKGSYTILIYTKTTNSENFDELQDRFRFVDSTATINNKKYTVKYNKNRQNRIELTVE